jgi:hypothetical protein
MGGYININHKFPGRDERVREEVNESDKKIVDATG